MLDARYSMLALLGAKFDKALSVVLGVSTNREHRFPICP